VLSRPASPAAPRWPEYRHYRCDTIQQTLVHHEQKAARPADPLQADCQGASTGESAYEFHGDASLTSCGQLEGREALLVSILRSVRGAVKGGAGCSILRTVNQVTGKRFARCNRRPGPRAVCISSCRSGRACRMGIGKRPSGSGIQGSRGLASRWRRDTLESNALVKGNLSWLWPASCPVPLSSAVLPIIPQDLAPVPQEVTPDSSIFYIPLTRRS
jgi:hypothetical protein